ncbi:MAG: glycosyltransferase family 39 protein [bacterium]|nr:glycosyltransferase family 39 protein [bacterium]
MKNVPRYACTIFTPHEWTLGATAFGIRMLYALPVLAVFGQHAFTAYSDAQVFYIRGAENILHYGTYSIASHAPFYPDMLHTPFYPFFLAVLFFLKFSPFVIVAVQYLLYAVAIILVKRIGEQVFNSARVGWGAAILMALEPMTVYWGGLLMSDTFFLFLFILSMYLFLRERPMTAGLVGGLAILTREIGLYLLVPWIIFLVYKKYKTSGSLSVIRPYVMSCLIMAMLFVPWIVRNKIIWNEASLGSIGWYNMYYGNVLNFCEKSALDCPIPPVNPAYAEDGTVVTTPEDVAFFKEHSKEIILDHPVSFTLYFAKIMLKTPLENGYEYFAKNILEAEHAPSLIVRIAIVFAGIGTAVWVAVYIVVFTGAYFFRRDSFYIFFISIIIFYIALCGAFADSRLLMPIYPFIFLLFCKCISEVPAIRKMWANGIQSAV